MSVSITGTNQGGFPTLAFAGLLGGVYAGVLGATLG